MTAVCPKEWLLAGLLHIYGALIYAISKYITCYIYYMIYAQAATVTAVCPKEWLVCWCIYGATQPQASTPDWQLKEGAAKWLKYQSIQRPANVDAWISEYLDIWGFKILSHEAVNSNACVRYRSNKIIHISGYLDIIWIWNPYIWISWYLGFQDTNRHI